MADSNELARTQIVTRDGVVTATVVDKVSPDRIMLMLVRGAAAAQYAQRDDDGEVVDRAIKDLILFPFSEV